MPFTDPGLIYTPMGAYDDWGPVMVPLDPRSLKKLASANYTPQKLAEFADQLRPRDDGRYVLLNAIGAGEWFGSNRNGDYFNEWSLLGDTIPPDVQEYVRQHGLPIPTEWGYKTFERYAYPFMHHENDDPDKTVGERVCCADYNHKMHRVELIVFINGHKAPEVIRKIDEDEPVAFSMGARLPYDKCLPAGAPVYGPEGVERIEDVQEGDLVFSKEGRVRSVTRTFRRLFSGTMVTLDVKGLPETLTLTGNHPIFIFRKEQIRQPGGRRLDERAKETEGQFINAEDVKPGDYIFVPKIKPDDTEFESIDPVFSRLCGYYLGDGHIITQRRGGKKNGPRDFVGVSISCGTDDEEHLNRVVNTLEDLSESKVHVYPAGEDRAAVAVVCQDKILAARIAAMCGRKKEKRLPPEIFYSATESRLALLGGLMDSDGSVDFKKSSSRITITLLDLMRQTQMLALSVGIPATLCFVNSKGNGYCKGTSIVGQAHLGATATQVLASYSIKCSRAEPKARWGATAVEREDGFLFPVKMVVHEEVEEKEVFNFSVEEDETYLVGPAVHNCSICAHPARKKEDYCEHLKNMLNYIFPDGRKVFSYNHFPRFFDISIVTVPADRSAYSLKKVAEYLEKGEASVMWVPSMGCTSIVPAFDMGFSRPEPAGMEKFGELFDYLASGGEKKADIDKVVPAHPETKAEEIKAPSVTPKVMDLVKDLVARDQTAKAPLAPEVVQKLKQFPLDKVLSGLTSLGIVLGDKDADEIIGDQEMPKSLDTLDFPHEDSTLISVLRRLIGERSMFDPHFSLRIIRISREGGEAPRAVTLVKRGSADRYREWLRTRVDLEKLAERIQQPEVQLILYPDELEKEIVGLSGDPTIGRPDALLPFIASLEEM